MEEKQQESKSIGSQVKQWRKVRELTQEGLARKADVPYTTLSKIESDVVKNPSIQTMMKIADGLEISLDELMRI